MKILIISDTHYKIEDALFIIKRLAPSQVIHLGDMTSDAVNIKNAYPDIEMYSIKGNNDFFTRAPAELIAEFFGERFFMTHGHRFNVKSGMEHLAAHAKRLGAKYALFGHTHLPFNKEVDGVRLLNPSSNGYIIIKNGKIEVHKY